MSTISLIGDTYPIRDAIKAAGFQWNKNYSRWDKAVSDASAEQISRGDFAAIKSERANKMGCAIIVNGAPTIVWRSKTFDESSCRIRHHVSAGYSAGPDTL